MLAFCFLISSISCFSICSYKSRSINIALFNLPNGNLNIKRSNCLSDLGINDLSLERKLFISLFCSSDFSSASSSPVFLTALKVSVESFCSVPYK